MIRLIKLRPEQGVFGQVIDAFEVFGKIRVVCQFVVVIEWGKTQRERNEFRSERIERRGWPTTRRIWATRGKFRQREDGLNRLRRVVIVSRAARGRTRGGVSVVWKWDLGQNECGGWL